MVRKPSQVQKPLAALLLLVARLLQQRLVPATTTPVLRRLPLCRVKDFIKANQTITLSGDVSGSGTTSITGTLATVNSSPGTTSGVTVNGKGLVTAIAALQASDIPSLAHTKISDFDAGVQANTLDSLANPTGAVDLNSQRITNLADPTSAQDAVTKSYADALTSGLDVKESVKVATTANITLSGTQTIDGVAVSADERVLVKNQSTLLLKTAFMTARLEPGRVLVTLTPTQK